MFKNQKSRLKFQPESGMKIIGMARLTLYEPRGTYQLIFEHLEPEGTGSIQIAFEQLKKKLSGQGIFDLDHKKPIPFLPSRISIITSGTGAAVRDILNVAARRFSNSCLEIVSVKVQGHGSDNEIREAIDLVNHQGKSDLIILARGGGSLEDLSAFNSEIVAMAIYQSKIPIITGVGHETDFTIADFTADLRAPTPSAAAELALPDKTGLQQKMSDLRRSLRAALKTKINNLNQTISHLSSRLKSPETIIYDFRLRLEDYEFRLINTMNQGLARNRQRLDWLSQSLHTGQTSKQISDLRQQVKRVSRDLNLYFQSKLQNLSTRHLALDSKLRVLNPEAVLERGYSISRRVYDQRVILDSDDVKINDEVEVILAKGQLITRVEQVNDQKKII
jgi:exodeoxyribonuclease VII large subunit